jgi:hypothetical protein
LGEDWARRGDAAAQPVRRPLTAFSRGYDPPVAASEPRDLTLDEALLWLNDRVGQQARVYLDVDVGEFTAVVLAYEGDGRIEHRVGAEPALSRLGPRDDIAGLYRVGDVGLDITNLAVSGITAYTRGESEVLDFQLADDVLLTVAIWAT